MDRTDVRVAWESLAEPYASTRSADGADAAAVGGRPQGNEGAGSPCV